MSGAQVLIVGAGPTGLFLACELARRGIAVRLIEQLAAPVVYSKALWVHTRTMEALHHLGVAERFLNAARPVRGMCLHAGSIEPIAEFDLTQAKEDTRFPMVYHLSQRETERFLTEHLASLGVTVEHGVRLERLNQDREHVNAVLVHDGGKEETVQVSWLCGMDGAHSTVRKQIGLPAAGKTYEAGIVQADCRIDWPQPVSLDYAHAFLSERALVGVFPLPEAGRYRLISTDPNGIESMDYLQEVLDFNVKGAKAYDPAWLVKFTIHCRMVEHYRVGRVFVGGDAAHMHNPGGGQGMNTGIQDAWNLGWKLSLVIKGVLQPSILDSYEPERLPVARAVLAGTDAGFTVGTRIMARTPGVLTSLRNHLLHFVSSLDLVRHAASRTISELDVGYPESPAVGEFKSSMWRANVGSFSGGENPGLRDWFDFGGGPRPGARAPDSMLGGIEGVERVYDLMGPDYTLFLFDGAAATEAGYRNLSAIAQRARERLQPYLQVHLVVPAASRPAAVDENISVILDKEASLHRAFGVRSESLYLIRPDRYIAFRSLPANAQAFDQYLDDLVAAREE